MQVTVVDAPVPLLTLVHHTLRSLSRVIPSSVVVVVDHDDVVPPVRGIAGLLQEALYALILDACEAMPRGGELRITVHSTDTTHVTLAVADTGRGLGDSISETVSLNPPPRLRRRAVGPGVVRLVADRHLAPLEITSRRGGGTRVALTFASWSPATALLSTADRAQLM
jgi:two-component system NtrC family sensor kinase